MDAVSQQVATLASVCVARADFDKIVGQFEKSINAIRAAQHALVQRSEVEEKLTEYLPATALEERVSAIVRPQIEETRSSIPEVEAVRDIARREAEAAAAKVPVLDPAELEDRVMEKVAPVVGALVGSDQFLSGISMVVSQRIDDAVGSRGLATIDDIERLLNSKLETVSKRFAQTKDIADLKKSMLSRGKGETDIKAAVDALKSELKLDEIVSPDDVARMLDMALEKSIASVKDEVRSMIDAAVAAKSAGVEPADVEQIVKKLVADAAPKGLDEAAVRSLLEDALSRQPAAVDEEKVRTIALEAAASRPAALDEAAVRSIAADVAASAAPQLDENRLSAVIDEKIAAVAGKSDGVDEAAVKSIVEDTVAESLAEFYRRIPKSPQLKDVIAQAVKDAAPAEGHPVAHVDPEALRPVIEQIIQARMADMPQPSPAAEPEALRPLIEQVVREVAPQVVPAGAELSPEAVSQAVEGQLLSLLSDPEYIKNLLPIPEGLDVEKIEKIARREGVQAVVQIFDSEEFAKRVNSAIGDRGAAAGSPGDMAETVRKEVRGALVELMESDLFNEKVGLVITQQMAGAGGAPDGEAAAALAANAADEIRQDLAARMEKVEQALPEIVARVIAEKGGAGADMSAIEEKITAVVANKVLGDKLDPALIQAEIKNQTPEVVKEIANSDEFKVLLDDKFKVILNYLKQDVIPKQVKKLLKDGK